MNRFKIIIFATTIIALLSSCKAYKQDIMFKLDEGFSEQELSKAVQGAERNYIIQPDDRLIVDVFTNDGERIVDPNNELIRNAQGIQNRPQYEYLVQTDGSVKLPIIGLIKLDSLTLDQGESVLEEKYNVFYKQSFVKLQFSNKRVVVLGAIASGSQIVPLTNENVSLVEVLAMTGGLDMGSKAQNVKVIRGNLSNPEVYRIDLSTISGMQQSMLAIEPGDIIYIEPWRRPLLEGTRDIAPILSLLSSTLALVLVLQNL